MSKIPTKFDITGLLESIPTEKLTTLNKQVMSNYED
jgi:hypothetical protein